MELEDVDSTEEIDTKAIWLRHRATKTQKERGRRKDLNLTWISPEKGDDSRSWRTEKNIWVFKSKSLQKIAKWTQKYSKMTHERGFVEELARNQRIWRRSARFRSMGLSYSRKNKRRRGSTKWKWGEMKRLPKKWVIYILNEWPGLSLLKFKSTVEIERPFNSHHVSLMAHFPQYVEHRADCSCQRVMMTRAEAWERT